MMRFPTKSIPLITMLALTACVATPQQQTAVSKQQTKASQVRFISPEQVKTCKYVNQTSITENNSFFGQEVTEQNARARLMRIAASVDANSVRITDRLLEKGRGGYDKTRLSLYADLYKC